MLKYYSPQSIERISKLHRLIQEEITGTPRELAFKFNVSERTIYLVIKYLQKSLNHKVLGLINQLMFFLLMFLLSCQLFIFITYKN